MSNEATLDESRLLWLEAYFIEWDALLAMPVDLSSIITIRAIKQGLVRIISDDAAAQLNAAFAARGATEKKYLEAFLQMRRDVLLNLQAQRNTP